MAIYPSDPTSSAHTPLMSDSADVRPLELADQRYPIPTPKAWKRKTPQSRSRGVCTSRRLIIGFLIFLSLFLVGTVVVLSTISYYLAIPDWAYLTEQEVVWTGRDVIDEFKKETDQMGQGHRVRRAEWADEGEDAALASAVEDVDAWVDIPASGLDTGEVAPPAVTMASEEALEEEAAEEDMDWTVPPTSDGIPPTSNEEDIEWSKQGKGSGSYYMRADWDGTVRNISSWERLEAVRAGEGDRIPRLIHQTWKSDILPPKWMDVWRECREGMQDYEYFLWTDELAREFIATHYPTFLDMYDGYRYPIQRADAIRYFVLHRYGGIYMDLDIGCRRRLDKLIQGDWDVILPRTKPVGVSNDLMFASQRHPFMEQVIHGLVGFDHQYLSNYPTVMFSTGPMFLSAQYGIYSSAHPPSATHPKPAIRILPKSLYGKNAPPGTAPHAFFSHFYGSSWHADDAGFITFLGTWGRRLMYLGGIVVCVGAVRYFVFGNKGIGGRAKGKSGSGYRMVGLDNLDDSAHAFTAGGLQEQSRSNSPDLSDSEVTDASSSSLPANARRVALHAVRRAGHFMYAVLVPSSAIKASRAHSEGNQPGLFFLPAMIVPTSGSSSGSLPGRRGRTASSASQLPPTRSTRRSGRNSNPLSRSTSRTLSRSKGSSAVDLAALASASASPSSSAHPPPPYEHASRGSSFDEPDADAEGKRGQWEDWNEDDRG